jgi:hypothetical protein
MFRAKAIQAEGSWMTKEWVEGVPGYLLGKTPNGTGIRNVAGGVLEMMAKS